jgi:hypothetical protein
MSDKFVVGIIHNVIKDRSHWYIDFQNPEGMEDIVERAKEQADSAISALSKCALYNRYELWRKSSPIIGQNEHYFHVFLNDLVWNLGKKALKGSDLLLYEENCSLTLKFI